MINKDQTQLWYGWFSLSAANSERENKLTGITTDSFYDVPVVANVVLGYQASSSWNLGLR